MPTRVSAMNLVSRFLLYALLLLLFLSLLRCGYILWKAPLYEDLATALQSLLLGLRFDLSTVAFLLLPALIIGPLLGMFRMTRALSRGFLSLWLVGSVLFVLLLEWITPYFMATENSRPDFNTLMTVEDPVLLISGLWPDYIVPLIIGIILIVLITTAFVGRLESQRILRYPISPLAGLAILVPGVVLAVLAIRSQIDFAAVSLGITDSLVSEHHIVNETILNTAYKFLYPLYISLMGG